MSRGRKFYRLLTVLTLWWALSLHVPAQIQGLPGQPQPMFGGGLRRVSLTISNGTQHPITTDSHIRLCQTSSATAVHIAELPWKKLELLPGQTVLEFATVGFPAVRAETRFLIQWLDGTNRVFGITEVLVFPTNLMMELKTLAGESPLGVFDPANELKPLLQSQAVEFQDLVEDGADKFHGRLAILGPFVSRQQMRADLGRDIQALAKRGVAVVWLQPPPERHAPLKPSFYTVRIGNGAVVVAQGELVGKLVEGPEAQLNLLRLAGAALHPASLDLLEFENPK